MITLHEVHEQGSEAVKAAVLAFGASHPVDGVEPDAEPNWKWAEKHFTYLIEVIMGTATPPQTGATGAVRRAENAAISFLLTVTNLPNYRCPICVKRRRPLL